MSFGYFDSKYVLNNDWHSLNQVGKYIKFLETFIEAINLYKTNNSESISVLKATTNCDSSITNRVLFDDSTVTADKLTNAVIAMSPEELASICSNKRAQAVAIILEAFIVSETYESSIYRLMTSCPDSSLANFFTLLRDIKNRNNKYILGTLASAIDDTTLLVGSNLNTNLMNFFARSYSTIIQNKGTALYNDLIKPVLEVPKTNIYDKLSTRTVTYNYTSFGKRLFKSIVNGVVHYPVTNSDVKSVVEYDETTGKLTYANETVNGFITTGTFGTRTFDAWDPLIIDVKGDLIDIYGDKDNDITKNKEKTNYLPAYLLYFAEKKANSKTTQAAVQTAGDILSLAIPGGQATLALRLLNYADKLSSVTSIMGTMTEENCPTCAKFLNITSGVLGVVSLGSNFTSINSASKAAEVIDVAKITTATHELEVTNLINKIDVPVPTGDVALVINNPTTRNMLIKVLEADQEAARLGGKIEISNKIAKAVNKLKGVIGAFANHPFYLKFSTVLKDFWTDTKLFKKSSKNAAEQIAHFDTNGKLIIDNVDNFSDLSSDAKLIDKVDDVDVKYLNHPTGTDDVLIFSDSNGLHCLTGVNCFTSNTLVLTKTGQKEIKEIKTNDIVLSFDEKSKKSSWKKVTNTFNKSINSLQKIIVSKDTIYTTADHKFMTNTGWIKAASLSVGMLLQTQLGFSEIKTNTKIDSTATVYNFTVQKNHTYYVGKGNFLVHNDCKAIAKVLEKLSESNQAKFLQDFKDNQSMLNKFANGQIDIEAWSILKTSYDNADALHKNSDALLALTKIRKNSKFTQLGLTDEILGKIRGYGTGTSAASYAEIINDLDKFGNYLNLNPTTSIENFSFLINTLKRTCV